MKTQYSDTKTMFPPRDFGVLPDVQKFPLSDNQTITRTYYELFAMNFLYWMNFIFWRWVKRHRQGV